MCTGLPLASGTAGAANITTSQLLPRLKDAFRSTVYELYNNGHNALMISQGFSKCDMVQYIHVKALADFLNPLFQVRILVAYRRPHEWLPARWSDVT